MAGGKPRTTAKQLFAERAGGVVVFEAAAGLELGHHVVGDVGKGAGGQRIGQVKAVNIGLFDPIRELFGDLFA